MALVGGPVGGVKPGSRMAPVGRVTLEEEGLTTEVVGVGVAGVKVAPF